MRRWSLLVLAPFAAVLFGWPLGAVCLIIAAVPGRRRRIIEEEEEESNNEPCNF